MPKTQPELPQQIAELAEIIGRDEALYLLSKLPLVRVRPGSRQLRHAYYIPRRLPENWPITKWIGHQKARALINYYRGSTLLLPVMADYCRHVRNQRIVELRAAHYSVAFIAAHFGMSVRTVEVVLFKNGETGNVSGV